LDAFTVDRWIWINCRDNDPLHSCLNDGVNAGRCVSIRTARLKIDVQVCPAGHLASLLKGDGFSVCFTDFSMESLTNNTSMSHNYGTDQRIDAGSTTAFCGE
jgi:hypothetical protein